MIPGSFIASTLRRRVTVLMLAAAVVLVGLISYFLIPLELAPKGFQNESVSIWVPVTSSNPSEVQEQVIRPAEELVRTIPGITRIASRASANRASLYVQFSREVDLDLAVAELRDRMERARSVWPADVRQYFIRRFNLDTDLPVAPFALDLNSGYSDEIGFLVEENVIKRLEALPGIAQVTCWGLLRDQVRIFVDRDKAEAMGISIYELTQTLTKSNVELSGGEIEDGETRFVLRTDARFRTLEEIRAFPVNSDGLRLNEIARVEPMKAIRDSMSMSRNRHSLWCQVFKESSANAVDVSKRIQGFLDVLAQDNRLSQLGVTVRPYPDMDMGIIITNALDTLRVTAAWGAMLAVIVLFFFLRRLSPTLIITTGIPLSLLLTLAYLYFSGGTLNIFSMLGITVSIGMLIDNSIVVVENIFRHRELGLPAMEAARRGASEVALAITLSTLTTVAAFLPIIFMSGNEQLSFFTSAIGLPLCAAVLSSLLVALVFIPLGTIVLAPRRIKSEDSSKGWQHSRLINGSRDLYARSLSRALNCRLLVLLAVVAVVWGATYSAWERLPKVDMMSDHGGRISMGVHLGRNFSLQDAYDEMKFLGSWIEENQDRYGVKHFWCRFDKRRGRMSVVLNDQDMAWTKAVAKRMKEDVPERPGVRLRFSIDDGNTEERGKLVLDIHGPDAGELSRISEEIVDLLEPTEGILAVTSNLDEGEQEIHIVPDREQAARYDIDPRTLRGTLEYGIRGWRFSDLVMDEREIPLIIEYEGAESRNLPELKELRIPTGTGSQVPLSSVAEVKVAPGFGEIRRVDGKVSARLTLEVDGDNAEAVLPAVRSRLAAYPLPDGYSFNEPRKDELDEAMEEMYSAVLLAVVFVFLLMGILFESFILPLAVLVAVPFSWAGAVWGLALTDTPFDFVGAIGVIVLVGIVVNNGIVLIDCAHRHIKDGMTRRDALIEAGRTRFRPILMTAATTVVGLIPMALSDGGGSQISYKALSRALIGGLMISTFFTLFFVPILYTLFDDLRIWSRRIVRAMVPAGRVAAALD
ncbi:MAG: efflux RND transporter permease subunit [Planctomycetota bacterium]|nr:efflux RND transporter permease subunit [Planctomycetota bacterium]